MLATESVAPLSDLPGVDRSKPVLLVFFKVSCPTCQFTFPYLQRIADGAAELQIVPVSQDGEAATHAFLQRFGPGLTALIDKPWVYPASNAFGIAHVPSMFLIESDGRISKAMEGFSREDLREIGDRFNAPPFRPGEQVPVFKPG